MSSRRRRARRLAGLGFRGIKIMKGFFSILLLVILWSAFGINESPNYLFAQTKTSKNLMSADRDNIREAVFRYQFLHNASGQ